MEHSGLLQGDLAKLNGTLEAVRAKVKADPHVAFGYVSPSGDGLKLGLRIDGTRHMESFPAAEKYFLETYGCKLHPSVKDWLRLCFVSHDPLAWTNPAATQLPAPVEVPATQPQLTVRAPAKSDGTLPPSVAQLITNGAPEGQRDTAAFAVAGQCRDAGLNQSDAERPVLSFARNCNPPFPEDEARLKVASAYKKSPRDPATNQSARRGEYPPEAQSHYKSDIEYSDALIERHAATILFCADENTWLVFSDAAG